MSIEEEWMWKMKVKEFVHWFNSLTEEEQEEVIKKFKERKRL